MRPGQGACPDLEAARVRSRFVQLGALGAAASSVPRHDSGAHMGKERTDTVRVPCFRRCTSQFSRRIWRNSYCTVYVACPLLQSYQTAGVPRFPACTRTARPRLGFVRCGLPSACSPSRFRAYCYSVHVIYSST
jgi:hypothetical protein